MEIQTNAEELKTAGLLAAAGLAAVPTDNTYAARPTIPDLPAYIARALMANAKARSLFQDLARRPPTRADSEKPVSVRPAFS